MQHNPGSHALAKMMLNSMWGKFSQRNNKTQVREFTEPQPFQEFLDGDQNDIHYVSLLTEDRLEVNYTKQDHCESLSPNLNIFVVCFTTCWARLHLCEALELLGEQVLYFDTDSVVFVHQPRQVSPALGQYLGEFKDELGEGDTIVEFCSAGPKNYGYTTQRHKMVCKVRGFSLNCQGAAQLNYEVLCNKMSWLNCMLLWLNPAPPVSRSLTPFSARPNPIPSISSPAIKITVWCVPKEWWLQRRPKLFPMATRG